MKITPRRLARGMSMWPPFLGAGIRVREITEDWTRATVQLRVGRFTQNYVGTAFGGSLSAMTDPFFMLLALHQLGRGYVVWDTKGEIEYLAPGRGTLTAVAEMPADAVAEMRAAAEGGAKVLRWFEVDVTDTSGTVVARVRRQIYVREKRRTETPGSAA